MADQFDDFAYPGETQPAGVIRDAVNERDDLRAHSVLDDVRRNLDGVRGRRMDCRHACVAWTQALQRQGLDVDTVGGEGVDDDVVSADYRLVPPDRRSGYREGDGAVHRHYWLELGAERRIFDPTAHQFDHKGGVSSDRYVVNGERAIARRA